MLLVNAFNKHWLGRLARVVSQRAAALIIEAAGRQQAELESWQRWKQAVAHVISCPRMRHCLSFVCRFPYPSHSHTLTLSLSLLFYSPLPIHSLHALHTSYQHKNTTTTDTGHVHYSTLLPESECVFCCHVWVCSLYCILFIPFLFSKFTFSTVLFLFTSTKPVLSRL